MPPFRWRNWLKPYIDKLEFSQHLADNLLDYRAYFRLAPPLYHFRATAPPLMLAAWQDAAPNLAADNLADRASSEAVLLGKSARAVILFRQRRISAT